MQPPRRLPLPIIGNCFWLFCYSSSASFQIIKIVELFCKHASPLNNSLPFFSQKCIIKKVFIQKNRNPWFLKDCGIQSKIYNFKLLDNCSNTAWTYCSTTFTISDWCIAVCKWWFFVWFVGKNPDFPFCPYGFWEFCYHGVITDLSFINENSLIIKFSYSIPFLLENSYFIKIISSSKFKSTAGNILCI